MDEDDYRRFSALFWLFIFGMLLAAFGQCAVIR